jgi:hypothetical protein
MGLDFFLFRSIIGSIGAPAAEDPKALCRTGVDPFRPRARRAKATMAEIGRMKEMEAL